jgi:hypothetical protein
MDNTAMLCCHHQEHARRSSEASLIALTTAERPDVKTTATYMMFVDVVPLMYDWTMLPACLTTIKKDGLVDKVLVSTPDNVGTLGGALHMLKNRETDIVAFGTRARDFAACAGLQVQTVAHPSMWHVSAHKDKAWEVLSALHAQKGLDFFETKDAFAAAVRKAWAVYCPKTGESLRSRRRLRTIGPKRLREIVARGKKTMGPERRSEVSFQRARTMGPERLHDVAIDREEAMGPDRRSERASQRARTMGPTRLSDVASKGNETRGAIGRSDAGRTRATTMGSDRLTESSKKGRRTMGPSRMADCADAQRATKKNKWLAAYVKKNGEPETDEAKAAMAAALAARDANVERMKAWRNRHSTVPSTAASSSGAQ